MFDLHNRKSSVQPLKSEKHHQVNDALKKTRKWVLEMNMQTIVYLGLESAGLRENGRPRISEISLLAVNTNDFLELLIKIKNHISKKENCDKILPRIQSRFSPLLWRITPRGLWTLARAYVWPPSSEDEQQPLQSLLEEAWPIGMDRFQAAAAQVLPLRPTHSAPSRAMS